MQFIWVFIGGGLGSMTRFGISSGFSKFSISHFPIATFISNLAACSLMGLLLYWSKDKLENYTWISPLLITGFCGGFSTFSAWSKETLDLLQQGHYIWALANIFISILMGIGILYFLKTKLTHF
jgi:CrcB protein